MSRDHDHDERDLAARVEASRALRDFTHAFVTHDAPIEAIEAIGAWARTQAAAWAVGPERDRLALMRAARDRAIADGHVGNGLMVGGAGFEDRAVAGKANPTGVDIQVLALGEVCTAQVVFRKAND